MSSEGPLLDRSRLESLLRELGARLAVRDIEARLFVVGGAAMALAFNRERVTRDLDAVFEPKREIYDEAARMAIEHELPAGWLNDGVKALLPDRGELEVATEFVSDGIAVLVASARYLFAMKAQAARIETDAEDLRFLADHLGITTVDEALAIVEDFYDPQRIRPITQHLVAEILTTGEFPDPGDGPSLDISRVDPHDSRAGFVKPYRRADGTSVRGHRRR